MEKPKIGFILTSLAWGGLELNTLKLANWLYARGWDITIYTTKSTRFYQEATKSFKGNITEIGKHGKYFDLLNARRFSAQLKKDQIRTIFVFENYSIDFTFFTKLFLRGELNVIFQQQMQIGIPKKDLLHTIRFSCINTWITPLNWLKEQAIIQTRLDSKKIKVIPLCTEIEKYIYPKYSRTEARNFLNINPEPTLIGIMGRIDPQKGQLFVVEAINKLIAKGHNDIELLILGDPTLNEKSSQDYLQKIRQYIADNNLTSKVHIHSHSDDVAKFYCAIDLFVMASQSETFGMVTIEAMLSGIPVIGTNAGGTPELLDNGELGRLYSYNNVDDFIAQVESLTTDKSRMQIMATKAKQSAIERFSHIKECEAIEQILTN